MIISAFSTFTDTYLLYHQVDPKMLKLTMEQACEVRMCICMFSGDGIVSPHCPSNYCVYSTLNAWTLAQVLWDR